MSKIINTTLYKTYSTPVTVETTSLPLNVAGHDKGKNHKLYCYVNTTFS